MAAPTFDNRDGWIWMDGHMVHWRDAKVHVLTHALHYSKGSAPMADASSNRRPIPGD
jgi:hypothetical protein